MDLHFLGTRGYINITSKRHRMHSSMMISHEGKKLMIDCGEDWRDQVWKLKPDAIIITHGHPDHAWGLFEGSPAPVYASEDTWQLIDAYPIKDRHIIKPRKSLQVLGLTIEAFSVIHSVRCPALGYRIRAGSNRIFYISDVVDIIDRKEALKDANLFIGDGATPTQPMVRRKGDAIFGHTTIRAQIGWCAEEGVPKAIFTHCGTQITGGDEKKIAAELKQMGKEKGVEVAIAYDGMHLNL